MKIDIIILILFFLIYNPCMLLTLCANSDDDSYHTLNLRQMGTTVREIPNSRKDKGVLTDAEERNKEEDQPGESSQARETKSKRRMSYVKWTNEKNDHLLRLMHAHMDTKANSKNWDWIKIQSIMREKYGEIPKSKVKAHGLFLVDRMNKAVSELGEGIRWTSILNENLLRIYLMTEKGEKSKHGDRILAEWVKMRYPGYRHMRPEYLLDRAESMLQSVKRLTIDDPHTEGIGVLKQRQRIDWGKVENYLGFLYGKYPRNYKRCTECIFQDAVNLYPALYRLGPDRVYDKARKAHLKTLKHDKIQDFTDNNINRTSSSGLVVNGRIFWKPKHDDYFLKLWKKYDESGENKCKTLYHDAVEQFPELHEVQPAQVYDRTKYIRRRRRQLQQTSDGNSSLNNEQSFYSFVTPGERSNQDITHDQYHMFLDDQNIPSTSRETHHDLGKNVTSDLQSSHNQPNLTSSPLLPGNQTLDLELKLK